MYGYRCGYVGSFFAFLILSVMSPLRQAENRISPGMQLVLFCPQTAFPTDLLKKWVHTNSWLKEKSFSGMDCAIPCSESLTVFWPLFPKSNSDNPSQRGKDMTAEEKPQKKSKGENRKWRAATRSTFPRLGMQWTSSRCRRLPTLMFPLPIECWWNDSKIFDLTDGFQNPETFKYRINTYG